MNDEWISAKDRLPVISDKYLVYGKIHFIPDHVKDKDWYYGYSIGFYNTTYNRWSINGDMMNDDVLYWTNLPKEPITEDKYF
jgi:hypothetical protein